MQRLFRRLNDWPLGTKLIGAFVFLSVAAITATTLTSVLVATNQLDTQLHTALTNIAISQGEIVGSVLAEQITLLKAGLAIDPDIIDAVQLANESYPGDEQEVQAQLLALDEQWVSAPSEGDILLSRILDNRAAEHLRDYQVQVPEQVEVFVTDRYGALVAASNRTSDYYQADEDWWQKGWNNGQGAVVIIDPELDASTNTMSLSLIVPIAGGQSGEVVGLIKAVYDLAYIQSSLADVELGQTGHLHLLSSKGIELAGHGEEIGQPSEEYLLQGGSVFSGSGFVPSVRDVGGETYVMVYVPVTSGGLSSVVDDLGWVTLVLQERSEAYASVGQTRLIGVFVGIVTALVGALLVFVIARILVTRQVSEIQKVFHAAGVGDLDARAHIFSRDELGRAAEGVNALLTQFTILLGEIERAAQERFADIGALGWAWEVDAEGRYTFVSEVLANTLEYTAEEMIGKTPFDFMPSEEAQRIGAEFGEIVANNRPIVDLENWNLTKDGQRVLLLTNGRPILDEGGNLLGYRGVDKDITESRQAEANLAEALVAAQMTYVEVDLADQKIHFDENWYNIYGTLPGYEDKHEMPVSVYTQNHLHPDSLDDFQEGIQKAVETDDPDYRSEVYARIVRANGEEGWVVGRIRVQQDAEGNTVRILATNQDITEARVAEAQLAAQNEALGSALDELQKLIANVDFAARQLSGASESIVEVITLLSGQATTSAQLADAATATAQEGDQAVNDTISAMGRIRESAQETTRRIKRLGEASQEIGEVVRLIDEIADRVTVLALNASIQAAAAGEAGRGFAVVAEEVQRLAERATNATRQIENMVKSIQGEINEAMIGVEETTHEVVDGSQLAQNAGERIADLNRAVGELSGLVQHVADTTSQQTTESLAVLAALAADLQSSVAALDIPADASQMSDNGGGKAVVTALLQS